MKWNKYDVKITDWIKRAEYSNSIVENLEKDMVTKDELNPKLTRIERDINNLVIKHKKDMENAEKLMKFDENETDIFVSKEPAHSVTNSNIISFLKSITFAMKVCSDPTQLDEMK